MKNFKYLFLFIISFLFAGIVWIIVNFYLPKYPLIYTPKHLDNEIFHIKLNKIFHIKTDQIQKESKQTKTKTTILPSLKNIKLKAIYNDGKKAFIIIKDKKDTIFLDLYQTYKGYKLTNIYNSYVIFQKDSKQYILSFNNKQSKKNKKTISSSINKKDISKKLIEEYKHNFSKIWNEIGIIKNKEGYKITYVKKGGIFDKLGLKTGDIIISVNGEKITNDAKAWNLYNNIDKYDSLEIEIKRNNKIKVINYEIN